MMNQMPEPYFSSQLASKSTNKSNQDPENRLFLLELNEFSPKLLKSIATDLNLSAIQQFLAMPCCETFTLDQEETGRLEPWVQWVSIHCGLPSLEHGVRHLGDAPSHRTLWDVAGENGISFGVWGAMNASAPTSEFCNFFVPDPWVRDGKARPPKINRLFQLVRYLATNYGNISLPKLARRLVGCLPVLLRLDLWIWIIGSTLFCLKKGTWPKSFNTFFVVIGDLIQTDLFLKEVRRTNPRFSILFLNLIAHAQHHHWTKAENDPSLEFSICALDRILERLRLEMRDPWLVANALSQKPTYTEPEWFLYRPKDHERILAAVGIQVSSVEPHMTYDAHLFFKTDDEAELAATELSRCEINSQKLFLVETYHDQRNKIFYRVNFTEKVQVDTPFFCGPLQFKFLDYFDLVCQRTAKHIPNGVLYSSAIQLPQRMENHRIFNLVSNYWNPTSDSSKVHMAAQ